MKEINALYFPEDLKYSDDHEWAREKGGVIRIGISDYAQDQLGDIVYVELPQIGDVFECHAAFGTLESVKAVSEIYMPVAGTVSAVNEDLGDNPDRVNSEPYDGGWMIEVEADAAALDALKNREEYIAMLKG